MQRMRLVAVFVFALVVLAGCETQIHDKPPTMVGGRPVPQGPDAQDVEYAELLLPGDAAYRNRDRYLSGFHRSSFLVVRRGLEGPEPNVHHSGEVEPPAQMIEAGGYGSDAQIYARSAPPPEALDFPIHAQVVAVHAERGLVMTTAPRYVPLAIGDHLTILRGGRFVGYARLLEVHGDLATALVLEAPLSHPILEGDSVSCFSPQGPNDRDTYPPIAAAAAVRSR